MYTKFQSERLKGKEYSKELRTDGKIILKLILDKQGGKMLTGFIWLRIGASGGLL